MMLSAINEEIAAPIDWYNGIRIQFIIKLDIAPINTDIVNKLCLFVGMRYCIPVTLFIPIASIRKESTPTNDITFSYPSPKNHGIKLYETNINPKQKGIPKNQTNL